jgi:hypothetical protein
MDDSHHKTKDPEQDQRIRSSYIYRARYALVCFESSHESYRHTLKSRAKRAHNQNLLSPQPFQGRPLDP